MSAAVRDEGRGDGTGTIVALSGGVGGAKLALGLAELLGERLTVIANTGDDFEHLGLHVSPDIDTLMYTLAGLADPERGWGRKDETWTFMEALTSLGGPSWFRLGDGDLAMHVERTRRLAAGATLSDVCEHVRERLGIGPRVLPMSDAPVRTMVETDQGALAFQDYFVARQCRPVVRAVRFAGSEVATMAAGVQAALADPALQAIVICPSNPYLSVDPILAVQGLRAALQVAGAPVIAVTPVIAGNAVKGPTAKIMKELGLATDVRTIAAHYAGLIDGFVLDITDRAERDDLGVPALVAQTLMRTLADKVTLSRETLLFATQLRERAGKARAG